MTKDLNKYYEDRFEMTASQGWKDLLEDAAIMVENYGNLANITSVDDLFFRKGQLDILGWLTSLQSVSETIYEGLDK